LPLNKLFVCFRRNFAALLDVTMRVVNLHIEISVPMHITTIVIIEIMNAFERLKEVLFQQVSFLLFEGAEESVKLGRFRMVD
jgi:hypothetical protein